VTDEQGDLTPAVAPGARGYSWPPFESGNTAAMTAGHQSPRKVDPIAQSLVEHIVALPGLEHLRERRFTASVWAWARAEAVVLLLADYCAGMTVEQVTTPQSKRSMTEPLELLRRWEATAATQRARLGLDPMSAAKLMRELTETSAAARHAGLDQVREQGAEARRRRTIDIAASPGPPGGDAA
jgi:hypothetical protein